MFGTSSERVRFVPCSGRVRNESGFSSNLFVLDPNLPRLVRQGSVRLLGQQPRAMRLLGQQTRAMFVTVWFYFEIVCFGSNLAIVGLAFGVAFLFAVAQMKIAQHCLVQSWPWLASQGFTSKLLVLNPILPLSEPGTRVPVLIQKPGPKGSRF